MQSKNLSQAVLILSVLFLVACGASSPVPSTNTPIVVPSVTRPPIGTANPVAPSPSTIASAIQESSATPGGTPWWLPTPTFTSTPVTPTRTKTLTPTLAPTPACAFTQAGTGVVEFRNFASDLVLDISGAGTSSSRHLSPGERSCIELPAGYYRWQSTIPGYPGYGAAKGEFFLSERSSLGPMFICINMNDQSLTTQCRPYPPAPATSAPGVTQATPAPAVTVIRP